MDRLLNIFAILEPNELNILLKVEWNVEYITHDLIRS